MGLNELDIDWSGKNVDYLLDGQYDEWLRDIIDNGMEIKQNELTQNAMKKIGDGKDCLVYYQDLDGYTKICQRLNLMSDHKFGMPRTSYRGIVIIHWQDHRILFVPRHLEWSRRNYT